MRFKNFIIHRVGLFLFLYALFFSYRLYFWGDPSTHLYQVLLNALCDTLVSYCCGLLLYALKVRYSNRKSIFYTVSSLTLLAGIGIVYLLHVAVYGWFDILSKDFLRLFNAICFQLLDSVAIVVSGALAVLIKHMNRERTRIKQTLQVLKEEKLQSEIMYLKARLDPHFVFNSLNTIFYQISEHDTEAKESLVQFSEILRYHLHISGLDKVSLKEELHYLQAYIEFQSKRTGEYIRVQCKFEIEENNFLIEPLLLIPLVENAFKFVCQDDKHTGWIEIMATYRQGRFAFNIKNSFDPVAIRKSTGAQMGLNNVLKRLGLLYKDKFDFRIENSVQSGVYQCNLALWN